MICKELNKEFDSKELMFAELKANKDFIIKEKKANIYKSCDKGVGIVAKSLRLEANKDVFKEDNSYYIAVNTTNVLDSHGDLHIKGIWNKTVKEQQQKNYLLLDHKMEMGSVAVKKENVEMFLADIPFKSVGKSFEGTTQALIYKVSKDNVINPIAKEWLESGDDIEASVRMQYVNVELAMNSDDKRDKAELKTFNDNIGNIANKGDFEELTHFWVVKEAKNLGESSLVLMGSNSSTGVIEAVIDTSKTNIEDEPSKDTQEEVEVKSKLSKRF
jgi:hypothetical protein